ncbi:hypothetical protein TNCV_3452001 [Trichonephila clavipes]|nr:hypothetical protein TNCV_3452001 [Trichonephila clavipes]
MTSCGRGSLVLKDTDFWLACRELEPSNAEDLPCAGGRCTLNTSGLKVPPIGVVWKLGEEVPAQVSSSSLDHSSKRRGPLPKALVQL